MDPLWRLIRERARPYAKALFVRFLIAAAVAATPYAFSFLGKWLVDEALQVTGPPKVAGQDFPAVEWRAKTTEEKLRLLGVFLAASLAIHLAITAASALSELLNSRTVHRMTYDLRRDVHQKLSRLEMGLFGQQQVGQLISRTLDDTGAIPGNLTNLMVNACTQAAMLVLGLVLLLRLNPSMTLVVAAALPFYALTCALFLPRLRRNAEAIRDRVAAFNGHIVERLANIATVKNYAQEDREEALFAEKVEANLALARHQHRLSLGFNTLTTILTGLSTLAALAFGFLNIRAQRMSLGEVLAFYQVTAQLFVPIGALVGMTTVAQTLRVLGERVHGLLDIEETLQDPPDAIELPTIRGDVAFERVSLRYRPGGPFAVHQATLVIPAGTVACIVGPNGCGKSTLIALLIRLYDPTEGVVRLDGVDIRKLRVRRLRRAIGNILHDCPVFTGTFLENLRFGRPEATQEEVEDAARIAELHDFIARQPGGYHTPIGRQGLSLNAEQRVKLAVARALVTRPAVLTIDDTFAVLDDEVASRLRAAIRTALGDRTVLVATSRLSLCQEADLVVVMGRGTVIQMGTHQELLDTPGLYRRMYMRQMGIEDLESPPTP
ncbi:MAG: ABC transporter ATP-binding protein [Candidatus Brocadiia bacterium]